MLINQWGEVGPGEIECNRLNATCPADGRVILQLLNFDVVCYRLRFFSSLPFFFQFFPVF